MARTTKLSSVATLFHDSQDVLCPCQRCVAPVYCRGCKESTMHRELNYDGYCPDCELARTREAIHQVPHVRLHAYMVRIDARTGLAVDVWRGELCREEIPYTVQYQVSLAPASGDACRWAEARHAQCANPSPVPVCKPVQLSLFAKEADDGQLDWLGPQS